MINPPSLMILFCQRGAQPDRGDGYQGEGEQPRRLQRPPRQSLPIKPHQVHLALLPKVRLLMLYAVMK